MSTDAQREGGRGAFRATAGRPAFMFYTYLIESTGFPGNRYVGHTADLKQRMGEHNSGKCQHTSKFLPWKLRAYIAFADASSAQKFERYLKSGSGRAFANRHFWGGDSL